MGEQLKRYVLISPVDENEVSMTSHSTLEEVEQEITNVCKSYDWDIQYVEENTFVLIDMETKEQVKFDLSIKIVLEPKTTVILNKK